MKENDQVYGVCNGYTHDGHGIVKIDGLLLLVKGMLEGEAGEPVVMMAKKKLGYGRLMERNRTSSRRVTPSCPAAKQRGGCRLQHMSYAKRLRLRKQKVQDAMQRAAHLDIEAQDVLGMQDCHTSYRNKGQIPVGVEKSKTVTSFYHINSNAIIDADVYLIQSERTNVVLWEIRKLFERYQNTRLFRRLLIKHTFSSDKVVAVWIMRSFQIPHGKEMMQEPTMALPFVKSVVLSLNVRDDNVILGDKEQLLFGECAITDSIHDLKFSISSKSSYQMDPGQTKILYGKTLGLTRLTGKEAVLDLYRGIGAVSMFLAQRAKYVMGIETVPRAIRDTRKNTALNSVANTEFVCSDAADYMRKLREQGAHLGVIMVNPSRRGCNAQTIDGMVMVQPKWIVYVSYDSGTLTRDLKLLEEKEYRTEIVQPLDIFPFTHRVRTVCLLSRKGK